MKAGKPSDHLVRGGLKEGFVKPSPYGAAVSDEAKKPRPMPPRPSSMAGTLVIFKGPLKDNAGKEIIAAGAEQSRPTSRSRR